MIKYIVYKVPNPEWPELENEVKGWDFSVFRVVRVSEEQLVFHKLKNEVTLYSKEELTARDGKWFLTRIRMKKHTWVRA